MLIFLLNNVVSTSFEGLCTFRVHLTIEGPLIGYNWVLISTLLIKVVTFDLKFVETPNLH